MTHFLAHQVFDDANLGDFIGAADSYAADLLVCQQPIGQLLTDTAKHNSQIVDFYDIRIFFKHLYLAHVKTS